MNYEYCLSNCPIGKVSSKTFLNLNDSAIQGAIIFSEFTFNCYKTCPYKAELLKMEAKQNATD